MIIDGKKIAEVLREKLKKQIVEIKSKFKTAPGLKSSTCIISPPEFNNNSPPV